MKGTNKPKVRAEIELEHFDTHTGLCQSAVNKC